jgi:hypothetical protein
MLQGKGPELLALQHLIIVPHVSVRKEIAE